jgi:hypothetical protein
MKEIIMAKVQEWRAAVRSRARHFRVVLVVLILALLLVPAISSAFSHAPSNGYWYQVRAIEAADLGLANPIGLTYTPSANLFFGLESSGAALIAFTPFEDQVGRNPLATPTSHPLNAAFYEPTGELFALALGGQQLTQAQIGPRGDRPPADQTIRQLNAELLQLANPKGVTFDAEGGRLFILDAAGSSVVRVQADAQHAFDGEATGREGRTQRIPLHSLENLALRGLAFNPANGHLYAGSPAEQRLYELTEVGQVVAIYDLAELNLRDPQGMVFAPSADKTDDPGIYNLYLADSGLSSENPNQGHIIEISFQQQVLPFAVNAAATLVNTIDTSKPAWNPSSPDPAGLAYHQDFQRLIVSDSEVEENHPDYQGSNVFQSTLSGTLGPTCSTASFSNEPTGVAVNPTNGHIFFADDNNDRVYEVDLVDGIYCNGNDVVSSLDTRTFLNPSSEDPEGLAYGANKLFISDGINTELYVVDLGANGVIGSGDDSFTGSFDTAALGLRDPEGVEYNPDNNTLLIVSTIGGDRFIQETTLAGVLVTTWEITFTGNEPRSGLAYGPSSQGGGQKSAYLASRGVDNGPDPNENDGKIWEIALGDAPPPPPTPSPTPPPPGSDPLYVSLTVNKASTVGNLTGVRDEDIIFFNGNSWEMVFDGSDVGLGGVDVNAFHRVNANTFLLSLSEALPLGGLNTKPQDILQFNATSLGNNTAGSFSLFFDGSDIGLTTTAENIDAIDRLADGRILISTTGKVAVPGVSGQDKDLVAFTPTLLGANTTGTWAMYFDGSDVGLTTKAEDIDAVDVASNGHIYLSTFNNFAVPGVSGADEDVFVCAPTSIGNNTACNYAAALYFDGSAWGLGANDVDGINLP